MDQNVKMRPKHPLFRNRAKLAKKTAFHVILNLLGTKKKKKPKQSTRYGEMKRYWQKIVLWIFSSLLRTKPLKHVKGTLYREARTLPKTCFMRYFPNVRQQNAKMQTKHPALRNVLSKICLLSVYELLTYEIGNTRAKHLLWRNRKKKTGVLIFFS